jgi:hypothetical protein
MCYHFPFEQIRMPQKESQRESAQKNIRAPRGKAGARPVSRDKKSGTVTVSLRIPIQMLKEIDEAVRVRPYKMPRHLWLLEAIHEKLTRLKQGDVAAGN